MQIEPPDAIAPFIDSFKSAWREGNTPNIQEIFADYKKSSLTSINDSHRLLAELIKLDLQFRWQSTDEQPTSSLLGKISQDSETAATVIGPVQPILESYLYDFSDVQFDKAALLDLVMQEYRVRQQWGDHPGTEEYVERFGELSDQLPDRLKDVHDEIVMESSIRHLFDERDSTVIFDGHADESPPVIKEDDASASEKSTQSLTKLLTKIPPFCKLSLPIREAISRHAIVRRFHPEEKLLRQGDAADCLIIMLEGLVEVSIVNEGRTYSIARVGRHTVLGEMSLVTQEFCSADVTAIQPVKAAILSKQDFENIAGRYPRMIIAFSDLIAERVGTMIIDVLYGKTINGYCIKHRLGRGAMGIVYQATETHSGKQVALKMMRHDMVYDRNATERFLQEAKIVKSLHHPNIIEMYDEFSAVGSRFIVMELCDGPTLSEFIEVSGPLPEDLVQRLLGQLAAALAHAHQMGIAHRDLKPANIIFGIDGLTKLADFGLATTLKFANLSLSGQGQIVGTPRYMAPEQLSGTRGNKKTDIYAFGCIAYELITGKPLFRASRLDLLFRERSTWKLPPANDICQGLSPQLYGLLRECLCEDPERRNLDLRQISNWAASIDPSLLKETESHRNKRLQESFSPTDSSE